MSARVSVAALAFGLVLASPVFASDVGYIYGRVTTVDNKTFEGQLRWGKEEAFWDDIFNADKMENEHLKYVDARVLEERRSRYGIDWGFFFGDNAGFAHLFAIRFGDLKRIEMVHGDDFIVEFRNGEEMELKGGSNDVGAEITVVDPRHGQLSLDWDRIKLVEFKETPARLEGKLGEPIYGTVKSGRYDFTGRIQWDNDECLTIDKLDGDTREGHESIPFGDIASITKHRRGALVRLKSGSELYMTGSNDVNHGNRGVVVVVPLVGSVKIGWEDFDEVTFSSPQGTGRSYAQYAQGGNLAGTVATRNGSYEGRIVFDLDESHDFELLHGTNGHTQYMIPFRDIARITPEGPRRAVVELKIGLTIELEENQDVTLKNDGLLVFAGKQKPQYVAWEDVREVVFR